MSISRTACWAVCLGFVLVSAGCGGGGGGDGGDGGSHKTSCNTPAGFVADAGPDQHVKTGVFVQLDGSPSRGAGGADPKSYQWSLTSRPNGSSAELSSSSSAAPRFTADQDGKYVAKLVIDGQNECDAQTDSVTIIAKPQGANSVPTADAGDDQTVTAGTTVHLNGEGSQDADGNGLKYSWQFVSRPDGSRAKVSDQHSVAPTFEADVAGSYVVELHVTDGVSISDGDQVTITAQKNNTAPVARAGADQSVKVDSVVQLDGSDSSDPNDRLISYAWHLISKPDKSSVELDSSDTVRPVFQPDVPGSYVASLVVSNGKTKSQPDTVVVVAQKNNSRPVANAGPDQNVQTGVRVQLNGGRSSDADNDKLGYHWTLSAQPAHSQTALVDASSQTPSFTPDMAGQYVAQLIVSDGQSESQADSVLVTASGGNSVPIADAGLDQTVSPGSPVILNGSASSDVNDDELSYHWTLVSRPSDSSASLSKADTVQPSLTADQPGFYVASLTVNDGHLDSASDHVVITAIPAAKLYVDRSDDGTDYEQVANSGGSADISLQAGAEKALLNRFRLKAAGSSYTVRDIQTTESDSGTTIDPYFDGLADGTRIKDGDKLDFATRLRSVPSKQGQYKVKLQFTLYPGGKKYNFVYNVEVTPN